MCDNCYQRSDRFDEYEKLFEILARLRTIRVDAATRGDSEQFILGVEASAEVVLGAINGFKDKNMGSIYHPNQTPLF
jgi:hypothetical protein